MRAILLAAGKGTRIYRHFKCPKSTLKVGEEPIIERSVRLLKKRGFDITIVLGYQHKYIEKQLEQYDIDYCYNPFFSVTNSLGSLWMAKKYLVPGETVVICNADVFWDEPLIDRLMEQDYDAVMAADSSRYLIGDYFFKVINGCVVSYGKELDIGERTHEYVGLAKIAPGFVKTFSMRLDELIEKEKYDLWWENVLYENIQKTPIHIIDVPELFWAEVDYVQDYERILDYVKSGDYRVKLDVKYNPHASDI